jgi:hypothetical protein
MPDNATRDDLIAPFEQRVELLAQLLELAQRQRRAVEEAKGSRLGRLIARRAQSIRQCEALEERLGQAVRSAQGRTLSAEVKALLRTLIAESEALVEAIRREDDLTAEAISTRTIEIAGELEALRKEGATLREYTKAPSAEGNAGVDRSV